MACLHLDHEDGRPAALSSQGEKPLSDEACFVRVSLTQNGNWRVVLWGMATLVQDVN